MECRILKNKQCIITQNYSNNHKSIDNVGNNYTLDNKSITFRQRSQLV